jgi:hypothetical protein
MNSTFSLQDSDLFRQQAYIGGAGATPKPGTIEVNNPATGEILGTVPRMGANETWRAIEGQGRLCRLESKTGERAKYSDAALVRFDHGQPGRFGSLDDGRARQTACLSQGEVVQDVGEERLPRVSSERFGRAFDTEVQRWPRAAKQGEVDGPTAWDGYATAALLRGGCSCATERREGRRFFEEEAQHLLLIVSGNLRETIGLPSKTV